MIALFCLLIIGGHATKPPQCDSQNYTAGCDDSPVSLLQTQTLTASISNHSNPPNAPPPSVHSAVRGHLIHGHHIGRGDHTGHDHRHTGGSGTALFIDGLSNLRWDIGNARRATKKANNQEIKADNKETAKTAKRDDRKAGKVEAKKASQEANEKKISARRAGKVEAKKASQEANEKRRADNVEAKDIEKTLKREAAKTLKRDNRKAGKVEAKNANIEANDKKRADNVDAKTDNRAHRKAEARIHNIVVDSAGGPLPTIACWEDFHCEDDPDGLHGKCVLNPADPEEEGVCDFSNDEEACVDKAWIHVKSGRTCADLEEHNRELEDTADGCGLEGTQPCVRADEACCKFGGGVLKESCVDDEEYTDMRGDGCAVYTDPANCQYYWEGEWEADKYCPESCKSEICEEYQIDFYEFEMVVDRTDKHEAGSMGMSNQCHLERDGVSSLISQIFGSTGHVHIWNANNPDAQVQVGDRIVAHNGERWNTCAESFDTYIEGVMPLTIRRNVGAPLTYVAPTGCTGCCDDEAWRNEVSGFNCEIIQSYMDMGYPQAFMCEELPDWWSDGADGSSMIDDQASAHCKRACSKCDSCDGAETMEKKPCPTDPESQLCHNGQCVPFAACAGVDINVDCEYWVSQGFCDSERAHMASNCQPSCRILEDPSTWGTCPSESWPAQPEA